MSAAKTNGEMWRTNKRTFSVRSLGIVLEIRLMNLLLAVSLFFRKSSDHYKVLFYRKIMDMKRTGTVTKSRLRKLRRHQTYRWPYFSLWYICWKFLVGPFSVVGRNAGLKYPYCCCCISDPAEEVYHPTTPPPRSLTSPSTWSLLSTFRPARRYLRYTFSSTTNGNPARPTVSSLTCICTMLAVGGYYSERSCVCTKKKSIRLCCHVYVRVWL